MRKRKDIKDQDKNRAGNVLTLFHLVFFIFAVISVINIFKVQYFWEPDPEYISYFHPSRKIQSIAPDRGEIIDHNGNLLAMSIPLYDIHMDCYVLKEEHENDTVKGAEREAKWVAKADSFWTEERTAASMSQSLKE